MGDSPDFWQPVPLETVLSALIDYRGKSPRKTLDGIPLVTAKIVKNGRIAPPEEFIAAEDYEAWMRRGRPAVGDVVITTEAPLGEVAQLMDSQVALAQRLIVLRGDAARLDNKFLSYVLQSEPMQQQLRARSSGTTVVGIRQSELRKIEIPLPPLPVQLGIAEILGSLDDKIELNRRTNATLEAIARALFKTWFVDFEPVHAKAAGASNFPGMPQEVFESLPSRLVESELGLIPEGWEVATLSSLCKLEYGKALKAANRVAGHVPVIGSNGRVGWHNKRIAAGPGIVVGRKGNPGVVTWVQQDFFPIDTTFYVVPTGSYPGLAYLSFALEFLRLGRLGSDSAVPGLNRKMAYGTPIVSPSREAAAFFEQWALQIKQAMFALGRESKLLTETRDALLPQLISGRLQVPST